MFIIPRQAPLPLVKQDGERKKENVDEWDTHEWNEQRRENHVLNADEERVA